MRLITTAGINYASIPHAMVPLSYSIDCVYVLEQLTDYRAYSKEMSELPNLLLPLPLRSIPIKFRYGLRKRRELPHRGVGQSSSKIRPSETWWLALAVAATDGVMMSAYGQITWSFAVQLQATGENFVKVLIFEFQETCEMWRQEHEPQLCQKRF